MCGFAGIIHQQARHASPFLLDCLKRMGDQIAHRGPDDEQVYLDNHVGIAFRRLSIVDVQNGTQPLTNEDNTLVLVVNGEIYNHVQLRSLLKEQHTFRSQSDAEIILHLYEEQGERFLTQLNGMFALLLWDKKNQKVLIARDRLGIKPLYYHINNERILFGSEIKALLQYPDCPRQLDWHSALTTSLGHASSHLPSFFQEINYLNGGEYLLVDVQAQKIRRTSYWQLPAPQAAADDQRTERQIIDGYHELLADSVRLQMMTDVEIGLFLSGGIDSVAIAQLASSIAKIPTFSVFSQSTFQNGDVQAAAAAARYFGLENHQVLYRSHGHSYDGEYWKQLLWHVESPYCSAEQLYKFELHRYAKQQYPQLKSILLGQGSDEFNGGYCHAYVSATDPHYIAGENNWDVFVQSVGRIEKSSLLQGRNAGLADYAHLLSTDYLADQLGNQLYPSSWEYYTRLNARNLQLYNLWHEDRTASAHGIENRVPFLDHRLVEYTLRIPQQFHKDLFWNKKILRAGFKDLIPESLSQRPKQPFFYGDHVRYTNQMLYNMIMANDRQLLHEALGSPDQHHPVVDRRQVENYATAIGNDPEYGGLPNLLTLINLGLLEKLGNNHHNTIQSADDRIIIAERVIITEFHQEESKLADICSSSKSQDEILAPIRFADNVRLLSDTKSNYYLSIDNKLEYILHPEDHKEWLMFLMQLDGHSTVEQLLLHTGINKESIAEYLEEAIEANILEYHKIELITQSNHL